jgi:hypothetical protein
MQIITERNALVERVRQQREEIEVLTRERIQGETYHEVRARVLTTHLYVA